MSQFETPNYAPAELEALEARFALRITAKLTEQAVDLPNDVSERLRFAREQAVARAHTARNLVPVDAVTLVAAGASATLGHGSEPPSGWWVQFASVLPLIALVAGLILIQKWHDNNQISAAAEIDASLLADDLPPAAYSDPGFVEYLKAPRD